MTGQWTLNDSYGVKGWSMVVVKGGVLSVFQAKQTTGPCLFILTLYHGFRACLGGSPLRNTKDTSKQVFSQGSIFQA